MYSGFYTNIILDAQTSVASLNCSGLMLQFNSLYRIPTFSTHPAVYHPIYIFHILIITYIFQGLTISLLAILFLSFILFFMQHRYIEYLPCGQVLGKLSVIQIQNSSTPHFSFME